MNETKSPRRSIHWAAVAAVAVIGLFVASRLALLFWSGLLHSNWEEPVFLFSSTELARDGIVHVFDHQDDLNHGGSLPLIVLGIPWLTISGADLTIFKTLAILWSSLILVANVAVGWRYFSPQVGITWGVFYTAMSGASARLNVTLTGSHPEVLLSCAGALATYLEILRRKTRPHWLNVSFGFLCAFSVWFSYTSLVLIAPLCIFWVTVRLHPRDWVGVLGGAVLGWSPWIYQNAILRPHGLFALVPKLRGIGGDSEAASWTWTGLLASFENGWGPPVPTSYWGAFILVCVGAAIFWQLVSIARGNEEDWRKLAPFLLAPLVGIAAVHAASPPFYPWDHHNNYRFFVPIQAACYWILAISVVSLAARTSRWIPVVAAGAVLGHAALTQAPLFTKARPIAGDPARVRVEGCKVYGLAEVERATDARAGVQRLRSLPGEDCRNAAVSEFQGRYARLFPDQLQPILSDYNVILINIDSLRADHLGCYGYLRDTSPNIDRLAEQGVLFENVMASSSFTRESVATLLTGQLPSRSGAHGWQAQPMGRTIAHSFKEGGYRTGFFSNTTMLQAPGFTDGFDEFHHLPKGWGISGAGPRLSARAARFIREAIDERFFLYLHYLDPHGPYHPKKETLARFSSGFPHSRRLKLYNDVRANIMELVESGMRRGEPAFEDMVARYDAEIADTDEAIGKLLESLQNLGLMERTAIVITSDHGEEFLEHGYVEHAWTVYNESLRVPLILWAPGVIPPQRVEATISIDAIAPTLLDLVGIEDEQVGAPGRSLLQRQNQRISFAPEAETPVISELLLRERSVVRSLILGDWKYIAASQWLPVEERPEAITRANTLRESGYPGVADALSPIVREELYHLATDPNERRDVSAMESAILEEMRSLLTQYLMDPSNAAAANPDPDIVEIDESELERMRSLGY